MQPDSILHWYGIFCYNKVELIRGFLEGEKKNVSAIRTSIIFIFS